MLLDLGDLVRRGLPVLTWSKEYSGDKAIADLVAGVTVGLTLIPQCIAYASLAGLGPEYGLYSSLCGGLIYSIFGTTPELSIAPTALVSLLTFSFTQEVSYGNGTAAILLCFLSGIVELVCGGLHLGFLVDFVSTPVVAAFTSAGAITIASAQVKNLLGLEFSAHNFTGVWLNVFKHVGETKKWDALLGVGCCLVLLLMRKLKDFGVPPLEGGSSDELRRSSLSKKLIWFLSVARNAFVVVSCAVAAFFLGQRQVTPFSLTSKVPQGLPSLILPMSATNVTNGTLNFLDMVKELESGVLLVPLVAILSNVAIAKAFAKGKVVDASQEMIAVGMCNLIGSFFGSYPISASFSRAAVSNASGVKTPLAGIYTGAMVILALTFLTPYFSYIPKATLAAVIICAVLFMVEVTLTKMIWKVNKIDLIPFSITLVCCLLLGIDIGILVGVGVDIIFLLYGVARAKVLIENMTSQCGVSYVKVTPTYAILFPSAEFVREKIVRACGVQYRFILFDCCRINKIDFTAAKCLSVFITDFKKLDKRVIFYRPKTSVSKIIRKITEDTAKIIEKESDLHEILKEFHQNQLEINIIESKDFVITSNTQL